jgi:hypothetical protein
MFVTCAVLFAGTWYFAGNRNRPDNPAPLATPKTTAELLIGTWECVEHDPPIAPDLKATAEYTTEGITTIRATHVQQGSIPPRRGIYQLTGETIRFDYPESADSSHQTWIAKIETITEDVLVLTSSSERTKRVVYKRVSN